MLTACADGCRLGVGFAEDDPNMVTLKLNLFITYCCISRKRSQSNAATHPEPAAVTAWR